MRAIERITIRHGDGTQARRLRQLASVSAVVVLALLGAGCSGSGHSTLQVKPAGNAETKAAAAASEVKITPANGVAGVNPSEGITVTAARGTLTNVSVHTSGDAISGTFGPRNEVWHSRWALDVAQTYTVAATVTGGGRGTVTTTSTFRTLTPDRTFRTEIFEGYNQTYGVGMPII